MNVAVSELRANLRHWIDEARKGEPVVITDRGRPVARLVDADWEDHAARLRADGVLGPAPTGPKPILTGRQRPTLKSGRLASDIISEHRR